MRGVHLTAATTDIFFARFLPSCHLILVFYMSCYKPLSDAALSYIHVSSDTHFLLPTSGEALYHLDGPLGVVLVIQKQSL